MTDKQNENRQRFKNLILFKMNCTDEEMEKAQPYFTFFLVVSVLVLFFGWVLIH
jgi:hypothetical protein